MPQPEVSDQHLDVQVGLSRVQWYMRHSKHLMYRPFLQLLTGSSGPVVVVFFASVACEQAFDHTIWPNPTVITKPTSQKEAKCSGQNTIPHHFDLKLQLKQAPHVSRPKQVRPNKTEPSLQGNGRRVLWKKSFLQG
jgi:hypothetical protein